MLWVLNHEANMNKTRVLAFLKQDVPGKEPHLSLWKKSVRALGDGTPAILLEILKTGSAFFHNPAVIALREFGYEAWAVDYGDRRTYAVAAKGNPPTIIRPLHPQMQPGEESPAVSPRKPGTKSKRAPRHKPRRPARSTHRV
jgi:hypothetical protein